MDRGASACTFAVMSSLLFTCACGQKTEKVSARASAPPSKATWLLDFGSVSADTCDALALDPSGGIYVAGTFEAEFQVGATVLSTSGVRDMFLAKTSSSGTWEWARSFAGAQPRSLAIAADGALLVAGSFTETAVFGATSLATTGGSDGFVASLTNTGEPVWARAIGGTGRDVVNQAAFDGAGNIVAVGEFSGDIVVEGSAVASRGAADAFIAKIDGASGSVSSMTPFGDEGDDGAQRVVVDRSRRATVAGLFSKSFSGRSDGMPTSKGAEDVFALRFPSAAN